MWVLGNGVGANENKYGGYLGGSSTQFWCTPQSGQSARRKIYSLCFRSSCFEFPISSGSRSSQVAALTRCHCSAICRWLSESGRVDWLLQLRRARTLGGWMSTRTSSASGFLGNSESVCEFCGRISRSWELSWKSTPRPMTSECL